MARISLGYLRQDIKHHKSFLTCASQPQSLGVVIKDYLEITFLLGSNMSCCPLLIHVFGMPDDKILPTNLEEREMKSL